VRLIRQLDLIDVDMSPSARETIDDLDLCRHSGESFYVPEIPFELLIVFARRGPDDLIVNEQVHASLVRVASSADQEIEEFAGDLKSRGRECPVRPVSA